MIIIEKKHRLPAYCYSGERIIFITICTYRKKNIFINDSRFKKTENILISTSEKYYCLLYGYVFMPDHLHVIIQGRTENSDIKKYLKEFKQKSGFWYSREYNEKLWQKNYYDRIIRNEYELDKLMDYMLNNPVRSKIVQKWEDYNYFGSQMFDLCDWKKKNAT